MLHFQNSGSSVQVAVPQFSNVFQYLTLFRHCAPITSDAANLEGTTKMVYKSKKHFNHSFAYVTPTLLNELPGNVQSAICLYHLSGKN